jgi:hypothetical protein
VLSRHFLYVYICIVIVDPIIKQAEGGDPILQFTADTFLGQCKPGTGFPSTYVVFFFFNHLKRDVVVNTKSLQQDLKKNWLLSVLLVIKY